MRSVELATCTVNSRVTRDGFSKLKTLLLSNWILSCFNALIFELFERIAFDIDLSMLQFCDRRVEKRISCRKNHRELIENLL